MESLIATLDYVTRAVALEYDSKVALLDLLPKFVRFTAEYPIKEAEETENEYFYSSNSAAPSEDKDSDGAEEKEDKDLELLLTT